LTFVASLDKLTDTLIWQTDRNGSIRDSPISIRVGNHDKMVISSARPITAYDPSDGSEL
jgi:hypothetical protein